jgi:hypothetical protein
LAIYAPTLQEADWLKFCEEAEEDSPSLCKISLVKMDDVQDQKFAKRVEKEGVVILATCDD